MPMFSAKFRPSNQGIPQTPRSATVRAAPRMRRAAPTRRRTSDLPNGSRLMTWDARLQSHRHHPAAALGAHIRVNPEAGDNKPLAKLASAFRDLEVSPASAASSVSNGKFRRAAWPRWPTPPADCRSRPQPAVCSCRNARSTGPEDRPMSGQFAVNHGGAVANAFGETPYSRARRPNRVPQTAGYVPRAEYRDDLSLARSMRQPIRRPAGRDFRRQRSDIR
jgi:hypothetical protein